jgi:altronate dehydratase small subunit
MALEALVLHSKDNVATAVRLLEKGKRISLKDGGNSTDVTLIQTIPFGHKFALKDIEPGEKIIKHGEIIGQATARIKKGEHVHVHNVEGLRGRGDRQ